MSIRLTRIYTRTGDDGTTALVGGERVSKTDLRIDAYGAADELNSVLGIVRTLLDKAPQLDSTFIDESREVFKTLQNKLFDLGSLLVMQPDDIVDRRPTLTDGDIAWLEQKIDSMNEELPSLKSFVLPGGGMINAHAHLARTICRRLELSMWKLQEKTNAVPAVLMVYVNRLSDYLFVYARWAALRSNEPEYLWEHPLKE